MSRRPDLEQLQVFRQPPEFFDSRAECMAVYCEVVEKVLLLQRAAHVISPLTWTLPGGKREVGETPEKGARRELLEETGIDVEKLRSLGAVYCRKSDLDYVMHLFAVSFESIPQVELSEQEHVDYRWVTRGEAKTFPLINGIKDLDFLV
ncbi:MAG: NUDIX hydrolase [Chlamydiia bacterium]|nr:NUDIX hydrolase [Chlamydiia bacterium]